ncbi:MAG: hypothetical protein IPK80_11495 [Nannocystis sp.]|nr:hypothetical protein [Nannocystis sp.]
MARRTVTRRLLLTILPAALCLAACAGGGGEVDNEESARLAYLGFNRAIDRAIKLGFDGFNAASNANIPEQSEPGELGGLMIIGGQVDAGASNNKGMRLKLTVQDNYIDGAVEELAITYNGGPADLDLSMQGLPNADLSGTLVGSFTMSGDLTGAVTLDLAITGKTEEGPDGDIRRQPQTVRVVGTATSAYGVFNVDLSL